MCHLLLFLPLIALPVFWAMPLSVAMLIYLPILLISGLLYWLIAKAMRKPVEVGVESLIGTEAEVVSKLSPGHYAQYLVRSQGELWTARCTDALQHGETVNIAAVNGASLVVERENDGSQLDQLSIGAKQAGAKAKERHCH